MLLEVEGAGVLVPAGAVVKFSGQVGERRVDAELGAQFTEVGERQIDALEPGESFTVDFAVRRGQEYVVLGACDVDCSDLDLFAYDAAGNEIVSDIEPDDYPVLQFRAREDATWSGRVGMVTCSTETCVFGIRAYER